MIMNPLGCNRVVSAVLMQQQFSGPLKIQWHRQKHTHTHRLLSKMMRSLLVTSVLYCMNRRQLQCPFSSSLKIGGLFNRVYTHNMYCVSVNSRHRCSHMLDKRGSSFYCSHTSDKHAALTFWICKVRRTSQSEKNPFCVCLEGSGSRAASAQEPGAFAPNCKSSSITVITVGE